MSSELIINNIYDFSIRLLRDKIRNNVNDCGDKEGDDDVEEKMEGTEVKPEILWRKSEEKTGGFYNTDSDDEEGDSVDSDSDATLTNEEGIYYEIDDDDVDEEFDNRNYEWDKMTTIPEETEDEEEDENICSINELNMNLDDEELSIGKNEGGIIIDNEEVLEKVKIEESVNVKEEEKVTVLHESEEELFTTTVKKEIEEEDNILKFVDFGVNECYDVELNDGMMSMDLDLEKVVLGAGESERKKVFEDDVEHVQDTTEISTQSPIEESGTTFPVEEQNLSSPIPLIPTKITDPSTLSLIQYNNQTFKLNNNTNYIQTTSSNQQQSGESEVMQGSGRLVVMNNVPESRLLRSVLRKPGNTKGRKGRCVTFNESLNLFYDAECSCWVHEDDFNRYRQEEYERREREETYSYEPLQLLQHHHQHHLHHNPEYDEPPTLSPPEGYKDRFFPQEFITILTDPDVTRVSPPSPPTARRKIFLKDNQTVNGDTQSQPPPPEEEHEEETSKKKGLRLGGILKGGRLWRSNSSDGKKVVSPPEEPDVIKCTESSSIQTQGPNSYSTSTSTTSTYDYDPPPQPTKVSIGTAPLRTSEQIRLAVDSTLRFRKNKKPECSTLVEKLRWLTSLDDEDSDSNQSGFATWPSRDKNGVPINPQQSQQTTSKRSDAGTSTSDEIFIQSSVQRTPSNEAKIKQISYTLEDIEDGLKGTEIELESFVTKDGGRMERIRKRYSGEEGGDDYGFSRRPSVKGIKPKFSSTNQIFAQFTTNRNKENPTRESEYENTRLPSSVSTNTESSQQQQSTNPVAAINYEFQNITPGRQSEESRAHFEMIRQSFEAATSGTGPNFLNNYTRPHSWSVSTLPHQHHSTNHIILTQHPPNQNPRMESTTHHTPLYGTVRRVPNLISRPLFLHYGALSVEAHPNKIPIPFPPTTQNTGGNPTKIPETPSPTQQNPPNSTTTTPGGGVGVPPIGIRYYGPPIRYYNQPPPVPPRTVTNNPTVGVVVPAPVPVGINNLNMPPTTNHNNHPHVNVLQMNDVERGAPEGATDEEHLQHKEAYSMNV